MEVSKSMEDVNEGKMTRTIEKQTARMPSIGYMSLAVGSMILSAVTSLVLGRRTLGNFIGLWVPTILLVGVYNKLVKVEASLEHRTLH